MKSILAAAMLALVASSAYAQMPPMNLLHDKPPPSPDEVKRQQALDRAYKDSLDQIPSKKSDPWGNIRGAEQKQTKPKD